MLRCLAIAVAGILAASGSLAVVASYAIGTHLGAHDNASKRTLNEQSSCLFPPRFFFPSSSSLIVEVCGHYSYARIDPGGGLSFSEITFAAPAHLQSPPGHCNECNTLITEVSFGALIFLSGIFSMLISNKKDPGMRIIPKYIFKKGVRTYAGQCAPPWCCHCVHAHWGGVLDSAYRYSRASLTAYTHTHNTHTKNLRDILLD